MSIKIRLIIMNFLQFAVWGAYLTSMGSYLVNVGLAGHIGMFYAMQGIVSLFMPAVLGIIADRWIPAQKLLSLSHFIAAVFMGLTGYYGMAAGANAEFGILFTFYSLSVAFYMPTLALSNSVAYTALDKAGLDTIKTFPLSASSAPSVLSAPCGWSICWDCKTPMDNSSPAPSSDWYMACMHFRFRLAPPARANRPSLWWRPWDYVHLHYSNRRRWLFSSSSPCCWACRCK